jgi:hypothetical protein
MDPYAARRVFDGERSGHGRRSALGQHSRCHRTGAIGMLREAGADVDDVTLALGGRMLGHPPGDKKNPFKFSAVIVM